jgi:serine/threonine protein kinase
MESFFLRNESDMFPEEFEQKYDRLESLGKGSFGMVWLARRLTVEPSDEFDDEFVAIKIIKIKDEKSSVYAEREIQILKELRHPNVIRLINSSPLHNHARLVIMQLARGPNIHQLIVQRGALGLPLARLVSRHLIAAVSYLHGRACIHRDIKPSNIILANMAVPPTTEYDWYKDEAIWSSGPDGEAAVAANKWKIMLVDFGFARALEDVEVSTPKSNKHMRNSIVFEKTSRPPKHVHAIPKGSENTDRVENDDDSDEMDAEALDRMAEEAALGMRGTAFEATNLVEEDIMGSAPTSRKRQSGISMPLPLPPPQKEVHKRTSTARQNVRSMSALGTKAYAAPEIRKKLRQKTEADLEKQNAALTECVADYGMNVDAYSVGWTLRVALTGVPPSFTISEYFRERENVIMEGEALFPPEAACCWMKEPEMSFVTIREPRKMPAEATLLIASMTEKAPEKRMTVREAQNHPYIIGGPDEEPYTLPRGDYPSSHGDPVVPLKCATELSKMTVQYHTQ